MPTKAETLKRLMQEANTKVLAMRQRDFDLVRQFNAAEQGVQREQERLAFEMQRLSGERDGISVLFDGQGIDTQERDELMRANREAVTALSADVSKATQALSTEAQRLQSIINNEVRPLLRAALGHQAFLIKRMTAAGLDPNDPACHAIPLPDPVTEKAPAVPAEPAEETPAAPIPVPAA